MSEDAARLAAWLADKPEDLRCPACGSDRILKIQYGMPTQAAEAAARRGLLRLGGCMIGRPEGDPKWECKACQHEFGKYER